MADDVITKEAAVYAECLAQAHQIAGAHIKANKALIDKIEGLTSDGLLSLEHSIASTLYIERNKRLYGRSRSSGGKKGSNKFEELSPTEIVSTPLPFGKHKGKTFTEIAQGENADYITDYVLKKWELGEPQRKALAGLVTGGVPATSPNVPQGDPFSDDDSDLPF